MTKRKTIRNTKNTRNKRKTRKNKKQNSLKKLKQSRKKLGKKNQKGGFAEFNLDNANAINDEINPVLEDIIKNYDSNPHLREYNKQNRSNIVTRLIQSHGSRPLYDDDLFTFTVPENATIFLYTNDNCPFSVHRDNDDIYLVYKLDIIFKQGYGNNFLELVNKFATTNEEEYKILQSYVSIVYAKGSCPNLYFGGSGSNETKLDNAGLYIFNNYNNILGGGWQRGDEKYNFLEANTIPNNLDNSDIDLKTIVTTISRKNPQQMNYFHIMTCRSSPTVERAQTPSNRSAALVGRILLDGSEDDQLVRNSHNKLHEFYGYKHNQDLYSGVIDNIFSTPYIPTHYTRENGTAQRGLPETRSTHLPRIGKSTPMKSIKKKSKKSRRFSI